MPFDFNNTESETSIEVTGFAYNRHWEKGVTGTNVLVTPEELINHISNLPKEPIAEGIKKIVLGKDYPIKKMFESNWVNIRKGLEVQAEVIRRQKDEDPFIDNFTYSGKPVALLKVEIIIYSKEALRAEGMNISADWGVISINGNISENEPMHPLTMARNFLEEAGGTKRSYTAEEFAEAIYFWSQFVKKVY